MSARALRQFINDNNPVAAGLAALAAALDAKVTGKPLDPALAARVDELLAALGAADVLDDVSVEDAAPILGEVRHQLGFNGKLLYERTRATSFAYEDPELLQDVGDFARIHAHALTRGVVPALGLGERLAAPGAAFLDIGVGVAGTALEMAKLWPNLRIVGIDVWKPSLALAQTNVTRAGQAHRIEIREQAADRLEDDAAFDLVWLPIPFMPAQVIPTALDRTMRALRPGGAVVISFANFEAMDSKHAATFRLRVTTWGGPLWSPSHVESLLRERGFGEVRTLAPPPGSPAATVVGKKPA